jgi:hypothetical protein
MRPSEWQNRLPTNVKTLRIALLLLLLESTPSVVWAQHAFSLQTGGQRYLTREPILSPLSYRGAYVPLQFSYAYTAEKSYQEIRLLRGAGELTSSITSTNEFGRHHYVELLALQFQYTYLRRFRANARYAVYGGGTLQAAYFDKDMTYLRGRDGRAADVFIAPAVTGAVVATFGERHRVRAQLSMAPLAYVAARTYAANRTPLPLIDQELTVINALKYGDWLALPRFLDLRFEVEYQYQLSRHWSVGATYQFQHYRYDKLGPFTVRSVIHSLLLGPTFRL